MRRLITYKPAGFPAFPTFIRFSTGIHNGSLSWLPPCLFCTSCGHHQCPSDRSKPDSTLSSSYMYVLCSETKDVLTPPGAALPGSNTNVRSLSIRQTASDSVSIAALLTQDVPCIPPTVSVASIHNSVATAQSAGRVQAQGFGSFLKSVWHAVQDVFKVIADVQKVLLWGDVVDIITLGIDAWHLVTDVKRVIIIATSPDGQSTRTFTPIAPYRPPKEPPCGGSTHKMCP